MSDRVAVILASAGRPQILAEAMKYVDELVGVDPHKIVSVPDRGSLPLEIHKSRWSVTYGVRGLAAQRNKALAEMPDDISLVCFFDDDACIRYDYVLRAIETFNQDPRIVGLTGHVLADGKTTAEIGKEKAEQIVKHSISTPLTGHWTGSRELYGANFVIRWDAANPIWFDERLPLYSWLEDHDMARRLMRRGAIVKATDCVIVHRAAASGGRRSHYRLGYSQVMNPYYLLRKGSFPLWLCTQQLLRPVAKNLWRSLFSRGESDWRRIRLSGNLCGARDIVHGRVSPERIVDFD